MRRNERTGGMRGPSIESRAASGNGRRRGIYERLGRGRWGGNGSPVSTTVDLM